MTRPAGSLAVLILALLCSAASRAAAQEPTSSSSPRILPGGDSSTVRVELPAPYLAALRAAAPNFRVAHDTDFVGGYVNPEPPRWAVAVRPFVAIADLDADRRAEVFLVGFLCSDTIALLAVLPQRTGVVARVLHREVSPRPLTVEERLKQPPYSALRGRQLAEARESLELMAQEESRFRLADGRPRPARILSVPWDSRGRRVLQYQDGDCKLDGWVFSRPYRAGALVRRASRCTYGE